MLNFSTLSNLTQLSVKQSLPWDFVPTIEVPAEVRSNKDARQDFHKDQSTVWEYYSGFIGHNPNQRISKSNPPRLLHAFCPEFDCPISLERAQEEVARAKVKPTWVERSLGGNLRLVYPLPRPLPVESMEFAIFLLERAEKWLACGNLPGHDEKAFRDPTRFLANGADWTPTGHGPIPEEALQAFFVDVGNAFRRPTEAGITIPLEDVEKALREKFPNFSWPGPFELESQGPSFFVEGSTSPKSAILKQDGFFTFSAHADKPFFSWTDLLGPDFTNAYDQAAIAKATLDIYFDGKRFWRQKRGVYCSMELGEFVNHLEVGCGLKGPRIKTTLNHIYSDQHVESAGPYIFQPPGLILYHGKRRLNIADAQVLQPAVGTQAWGPHGQFPFLSSLLDNLFTSEDQRDYFLAWWQYYYQSGLEMEPQPGQAVFFMGGVAVGKSFTGRELVGRSVGGFADAGGYLVRGGEFTSHLLEVPLWVMDDETVADSPQASANIQMALKKIVANDSHLFNKKFAAATMVAWAGRAIITTNLDYISSRMLGPLDNSSLDKISVLRCAAQSKIKFPSRPEMIRTTQQELPFLLRWLVDHTPPDHVERDARFGVKSKHEESLMEQAHQTSKVAPFKELLIDSLARYFQDNPGKSEWRGPVSHVVRLFYANPLHEAVMRAFQLSQCARYLEGVEREGLLQCYTESVDMGIRIWVFPRLPAYDNFIT